MQLNSDCVTAGIGYTMIGINMMVSTYYNVILALAILYLAASFTSHLPWADCDNWWNRLCSKQPHSNFPADCIYFYRAMLAQSAVMR